MMCTPSLVGLILCQCPMTTTKTSVSCIQYVLQHAVIAYYQRFYGFCALNRVVYIQPSLRNCP